MAASVSFWVHRIDELLYLPYTARQTLLLRTLTARVVSGVQLAVLCRLLIQICQTLPHPLAMSIRPSLTFEPNLIPDLLDPEAEIRTGMSFTTLDLRLSLRSGG